MNVNDSSNLMRGNILYPKCYHAIDSDSERCIGILSDECHNCFLYCNYRLFNDDELFDDFNIGLDVTCD